MYLLAARNENIYTSCLTKVNELNMSFSNGLGIATMLYTSEFLEKKYNAL